MLLSMAFSPSQTPPARLGSKIGCLRKCSSPIVLRFPWPLTEPNDFTYVRIFNHFLYSKDFNGGEENYMIEHTHMTLRTSMVKKIHHRNSLMSCT